MLYNKLSKKNNKQEIKNLPIKIAGTISDSIVDGPDLRFVIFVQGCPHGCLGCHNPQTHDINLGIESTTVDIWNKIKANPMLRGVTFSGGEPFIWANELSVIAKAAHGIGLNIMSWTGYTYGELLDMAKENKGVHDLLSETDYLVDGRFMIERRNLNLLFRGSENQRILDISGYPIRKYAIIMGEDFKSTGETILN